MALVAVTTATQRRAFVELPYRFYAGHPHWVPPLRRDEYRRLSPRHNPFLQHAEMAMWIAERDGRVTGRIAAIDDRLHNDTHREHVAFFGFFEADTAGTARELLAAAEQWGRERGARTVRGPVNPSLNESAGLLIDAFDEDPFILMPFNPPEYAQFIEACGYRKIKDLLAWSIDMSKPLGDRIARVAERIRRRHGLVVRPVRMRAFDRDLDHLRTIYRAAWRDNWGFVPPTDAEIRQLALDLKPILDPSIVLFAEMDGRAVGCAVAVPDMNQVLKRMGGRLFPFGVWHVLRRKSIVTQARMLLAGVLPEVRHIGIYPLLIAEIWSRGIAAGYRRGELSWTLEDNHDVNAGIEAAGGRRYKTYRLYEKPMPA